MAIACDELTSYTTHVDQSEPSPVRCTRLTPVFENTQLYEPLPMDPLVLVDQACGLWSSSLIIAAPPQSQFTWRYQASDVLEPEQCSSDSRQEAAQELLPFELAGRKQDVPAWHFKEPNTDHTSCGEEAYNLRYEFVMEFFGAGDEADRDIKECLYRCVNAKRLPITEKLAMMQKPFSLQPLAFLSLPAFIRNNSANLVEYLLGQRLVPKYDLTRNAKDDSFKRWSPYFQVFTLAASDAFGSRLLGELAYEGSIMLGKRWEKKTTICKLQPNDIARLQHILKVMRTARRRWKKALEKRRNRV